MNVFTYAATCEQMFENYLKEMSGYERKTTFYADLSIAEWCGGSKAVQETYKRVMKQWMSDIEYITEFVMAINIKSWEHYERGNETLSKLYSELYHKAYEAVANHYENDEKAISYFWHTLD